VRLEWINLDETVKVISEIETVNKSCDP